MVKVNGLPVKKRQKRPKTQREVRGDAGVKGKKERR